MKIKTSELTGSALDWLVAKCNGEKVGICLGGYLAYKESIKFHPYSAKGYRPSTDWSQGGPIIQREGLGIRVHVIHNGVITSWASEKEWPNLDITKGAVGPTPLIAAMRAYIVSELGDEAELPEELA